MTGSKTDAVCVLDMATLRVLSGPDRRVDVIAPTGELLASYTSAALSEPSVEPGAVVLEAFDEVLAGGRVLRRVDDSVTRCRVALLNPFTGEVALGALPKTTVFSLDTDVPSGGVVLLSGPDGLTLHGERVESVEMRRDGLVRSALAHAV